MSFIPLPIVIAWGNDKNCHESPNMSRIFRLHQLLQAIRNEAQPVTAEHLATVMGVSARTIHRDVATLRELGAGIDGAAGLGLR